MAFFNYNMLKRIGAAVWWLISFVGHSFVRIFSPDSDSSVLTPAWKRLSVQVLCAQALFQVSGWCCSGLRCLQVLFRCRREDL